MLGTHVDTCRLQADIDAVRAVVALRGGVIVRVHVQGVVWARLRTCFAPNTSASIEIYDPVLTCKERRHRTYLDARCVGAVIAPHHGKQPSGVGKLSLLDVLYPRTVYTDRNFVLSLAGDSTGMAADTLTVVDNESEVHKSREAG